MKEPSLSEIEGRTPDSGIGMDQMDGKYTIITVLTEVFLFLFHSISGITIISEIWDFFK